MSKGVVHAENLGVQLGLVGRMYDVLSSCKDNTEVAVLDPVTGTLG